MFEAYKVGVTLALNNQVAGALGMIARQFATANGQAKQLQGTLKQIKLLGLSGAILGGAGFMGLHAIKATIEPAKEYVHQLERANVALKNLSPAQRQLEMAQMTAAAWKTTGDVMTTTASQNLEAIQELRMVFGSTGAAAEHIGTVQKLQAVLQSVKGGNAKNEAYGVAKALEMKGDVRSAGQFDSSADLMTKAIIASGGKVGSSDFFSTFKYGRAATIGWNDQFTYGILPTLIQEMKTGGGTGGAGGPGNALMSAYAAVVGGSIPQKSLKVWQQLGLLDPSKIVWDKVGAAKGVAPGGIRGSQEFQSNPYQWTRDVLMPALASHGYGNEKQQREALQYLFPNRTAGFIMGQMAMQGWKFDRDQKLIGQAGGLSSYDELIKRDPVMAERAAAAQWKNLKTVIGIEVIPVLIPMLHGLAGALQSLSSFAREHPTLTKGLVGTFAALSGMAAIGGTLMVAAAGLKLIGTAFGGMAALPFAGIGAGLATITAGLAAIAGIVYHQQIANKIDSAAPGVGDWLFSAASKLHDGRLKNFLMGDGYSPPGGSGTRQINTAIHLDGRQIASVVTQHQEKAANGPSNSGNGFDPRQSFFLPFTN